MDIASQAKGLRLASGVLMFFGVLVFTGSHPAVGQPVMLLAGLLIWPLDGGQDATVPVTRLLAAISGGVMVGWGLLIWLMCGTLFERAPHEVRRIVLISVVAWAIFDSTGSVLSGVPLNVGGNLLFVIMFFWVLRQPAEMRAAV